MKRKRNFRKYPPRSGNAPHDRPGADSARRPETGTATGKSEGEKRDG